MFSPSSLSLFFCENERGKKQKHKKLKCCSCGGTNCKLANKQKKQLKVNVCDAAYANMKWSHNYTDTQRAWLPEKNG